MDDKVGSTGTRPEAVQLRARRSPKLVVAGVLAVVLGALGFAQLHTATTNHRGVVSVAEPIARGALVEEGNLRVVQVPQGFPVEGLPEARIDEIVGRTALTDLPVGSFPEAAHVGDNPLPKGQALVGLRLSHGQLPLSALPAGTQVRLVGTEAAQSDAPADEGLAAVVAVAPVLLDDGVTYTLDVRVPQASADAVARLAARGELALVALGEG
ncbi:SAF domain-containing protein [uncultured Tessaracoccus sp.]|uniref:SAF domain-containing protein n=1 Tax=uncultured Tessaracoccus sp. TaxID=905023 RepID=UPI0025D0A839|nr:SAF domain-containing protein [uncultured Tessaracoccus sp.]